MKNYYELFELDMNLSNEELHEEGAAIRDELTKKSRSNDMDSRISAEKKTCVVG